MVCRDFILPEGCNPCLFFLLFNLRNLLYLILGIKAHFNSPNFDCSKFYNVPKDHIDLVKQSLSKNPEEFALLLKSGMLGLEYILTH